MDKNVTKPHLLAADKDGKMERVALLLCEQRGGRAGRGPNELLGGQGEVPEVHAQCQVLSDHGQTPKDHDQCQAVVVSPDKVLSPLKFFPAGSWALLLASPNALRSGPSGQEGGSLFWNSFLTYFGDTFYVWSIRWRFHRRERFISETYLATALITSVSDLICKEDRAIT